MRKIISLTVLLALSLAAAAQTTVKGIVYEDLNGNSRKDSREKGIPGVLVSNGSKIVTTDAKGRYELPVGEKKANIFVIKPQGWISPLNAYLQPQSYYMYRPEGSPELQKGGFAPTGPLPKSLDFPLVRFDDPEEFSFFVFGDPQPYSEKEMDYFHKGIVLEAASQRAPSSPELKPAFGIALGDITGERQDMYPYFLDVIKDMGVPFYETIGNHDRNYDAGSDEYANEAFESFFGPSTYAFQYGKAHFLILDDIYMHKAPKANPYLGGFTEDQFEFIENYVATVPKGELLIISYHIPINFKPGQFDDTMRRRYLSILEGHNVFSLSAHSHIQQQVFADKELGWNGEKPFYEYNVGTSNGDWYSGQIGPDGTPVSMMRDGTAKGYAIVTVRGSEYIYDWKTTCHDWDYQMSVYATKVIPYDHGSKYPIYVNFFTGGPDDTVEFRIDGGKWTKMTRVTDETDPTYQKAKFDWDIATEPMDGRRPDSTPFLCNHLWKGRLDNKAAPGPHHVDIRARDIFGRTFHSTFDYITAEVK